MPTADFFNEQASPQLINDRLGFALCLALALHAAIILGISFSPELRQEAATKLEITLAQYKSNTAPDQADFIAQHDQEGSGTLKEAKMLTTEQQADFNDTKIRKVSPQQQQSFQQEQLAKQQFIVSNKTSNQQLAKQSDQQAKEPKPFEQESEKTLLDRRKEISSLEAKLDIQRQAYAKRPRIKRLTSVATKRSSDARYLHKWREKIEAIGNQNYPAAAKQQRIFGELRLVVSLLPDGSVFSVKILSSSGHAILDQAAIKIVHLAAPYPPFPKEMNSVDVLEIIRTWRFHENRLSSTQ